MGLFDLLRSKQVTTEELPSYFSATVESSSAFGGSHGRPSMSQLADRYGMLVHRCVSINASTAASIRPRLYVAGKSDQVLKAANLKPKAPTTLAKAMIEGRLDVKPSHSVIRKVARFGGDITEVESHPFLDLLEDVNPWTEGYAWRESVYSDLQIFGRSFTMLVSDTGPPTEMWRLLPQEMKIQSKKGEYVSSFEYGSGADKVTYAPDDVFWVHLYDPLNPIGGMSPLEAWIKTVDTQVANADFIEYMYRRGGAPDFLLMAKQGISTEQKRAFRSEFRKLFGRMVGRKETIAILSGEAELKPLQRPPRELQSVEHERITLDNIAIAFGVPKSLLTSDDVNLANAREGSVTHARNTIWPMVTRFEDVMNQRLLPKWSDRLFIMHESPISEDRTIRLQERRSQLETGYTINEIRTADGLPSIEADYADEPMMSSSIVPVDAPADDDAFMPTERAVGLNLSIKSDDVVVDEDGEVEPFTFTGLLFNEHECDTCGMHAKANEEFGDASDGDGKFDTEIEAVIRKFLKQVLSSIRNASKGADGTITKADRPINAGDNILFFQEVDMEGISELLAEVGRDNIATIMFGSGRDAMISLEEDYGATVGAAFDINTDGAQDYIESETRKMFVEVSDTLSKDVRREISSSIAAGEPISAMTDKINGWLDDDDGKWTKWRSKRIARTETRFAQEAGKMEGWEQSGVVAGKEFLIAPGACLVCGAVNDQVEGKMFPIDGNFYSKGSKISYIDEAGNEQKYKFNYTDVKGPPIHPNCRCTLIPVVADD